MKPAKKALITGHCGFVGRHFHERLVKDGYTVFTADIADPVAPLDCRQGFHEGRWGRMDLVIHCAATIPPIDQRHHNDMPVAADFALDADFFQWALRTEPIKMVYISSSAAYPIHLQRGAPYRLQEFDIDLDNIAEPDSMYGLTKLVGEVQAREAKRQGLDILVVRPQSGYGADQSLDYPFPSFIARAKNRDNPFAIWGDGKQVRDWIHIDDFVGAIMAMLAADFQGPVNLGNGRPTSMEELARLMTSGYMPRFDRRIEKPAGAVYRCADPTLMLRYYTPKISLEEGIRRAMEA